MAGGKPVDRGRVELKDMTANLPEHGRASGLDAVMNTLVDAAIVIDGDGLIRLINPAGERIFEYAARDLVGRNVNVLMPEPYHAEHDQYIRRYVETGEAHIIGIGREVEGRRRSGEVFPMHLAVGRMGRNGTTLFIGIIRDLTDERRRQSEFEALQARHFHLSRVAAMNEMGTAIAHEINQPLAATANYIETARILAARDDGTSETMGPVLDKALEQNGRASDIIARMRRFIERGDVTTETLDLEEVVDASLQLGLSKHRDAGIALNRRIDPEARFVRGDPVQIQQVLVNLIRNGCEAMEGRASKRLALEIAPDTEHPDMARIDVSDTGSGLAEDTLADLFTAFSSTKAGGLGVGLSISRSIVRAHGGRIWASGNEAGGATFAFTLPLARPPSTERR